jgi:hypothetical protein
MEREDVIDMIESHPDATRHRKNATLTDALAFTWEGPNDVGLFKNLIEGGWAVTSMSTMSIPGDTLIWIEDMPDL